MKLPYIMLLFSLFALIATFLFRPQLQAMRAEWDSPCTTRGAEAISIGGVSLCVDQNGALYLRDKMK